MQKVNQASEWIVFAESDWAIAKQGKKSKKILYETLCFHCQQASEKALKAVLIFYKVKFPKTHDIDFLLGLLEKRQIDIPKLVYKSRELSDYAVISRYPGDEQEVSVKEYKSALQISLFALKWAKSMITNKSDKLF